jgi:isochorismate synthase
MSKPAGIAELNNAWQAQSGPDLGWAFYRFPGTADVFFTGGKTKQASFHQFPNPSFVIAPFHSEDGNFWKIENTLSYKIRERVDARLCLPFFYKEETGGDTPREHYCSLVENVLEAIGDGNLTKAVPARTRHIKIDDGFNHFDFYNSLLTAYPQAFVYMLSTPETGTWIGCTPELLLKARGNQISTLALAGTRKIEEAASKGNSGTFSAKEFDEQVIVTDYIRGILDKYCSALQIHGPELLAAGNVYHLATYFEGTLKSGTENEHEYGSLLKELHPTPAVCGLPLATSLNMLLEHEDFDRELYSGFLGPVTHSTADLFVNLRCMQVHRSSVRLYAGAGVVKGSEPEKEWLETGEKMKTLLRFL